MATFTGNRPSAIIGLAALVVVIYGMQAAKVLLVPFMVAIFIALITVRPMLWMQSKRVPTVLAVLTIVIAIVLFLSIIVAMVGASISDFTDALPAYQARFDAAVATLLNYISERFDGDWQLQRLRDIVDPGWAVRMAAMILNSVREVLTNIFLIVLTVIFILLEASSMPTKVSAALLGRGDIAHDESFGSTRVFLDNLGRYLGIKTLISMATGLLIGLLTWLVGLDFPLLWGMLAFLLNYIPTIGSILAAIPAVLLALVTLGFSETLITAAGFATVNVVFGNFLEPRLLGHGVGISPLIVFVGLFFWGWVFGPVGMLLSVPLTMTVKMAVESSESTRWIGMLLGSERDAELELERWR
ncbi:MAG: AI-2E family transporter [Gammaproteobacteria bacterium]|nr:AI-2E family transporter [Gammaproteobacteria bacterium]